MPCLETIIRNMYLKEDHMSGKTVIVMGKKGVVANKTGSDGITLTTMRYTMFVLKMEPSLHYPVRDMQMIGESVEQLDEALTLASDNLNLVKKTAEKLARQSPDLTYYVVKHNERYMKGMKYAYYEVYQSVDMHLVRGKVKKIAGYGAKVDMRESVELDEVTMDPTEHVKKDDETGMYCVYNKGGEKVKEFKDKADADKYAIDNHDSLMENRLTDIVKKATQKAMAAYKNSDTKYSRSYDQSCYKSAEGTLPQVQYARSQIPLFATWTGSGVLERYTQGRKCPLRLPSEIEKKYPGHFKESVEHLDEMQPHAYRSRRWSEDKNQPCHPDQGRIDCFSRNLIRITRSGPQMDTMFLFKKTSLKKKFKGNIQNAAG